MDVKKALCDTTENKYQRNFYTETICKQYNDASLEKQLMMPNGGVHVLPP